MKQYKMAFVALFLVGIFILFLTACKKEPSAQYSTWVVDGDTISTNNVSVDRGKATLYFFTKSSVPLSDNNRFGFEFIFNSGGFVVGDSLKLDCSTQNPSWLCLNILYNDTGYSAHGTQPEYIQASIVNGKARYTLQPTWFYNSYRPADSRILVSGVFNEP
ncbi:MAG: hypothetical protein JST36_10505 [Bacteroidetes bacterium]|nr:hypothetical protein [Bacteroidota bacterium]